MKHVKILSIALAGALTFSGTLPVFAATVDIPENYWAKSIIESVVDKGIMNLYEGNKFIPNAQATQLEAIVTLYKAAEKNGLVKQSEVLKWVAHYEKDLTAYNIPRSLATYGNDVYPAMAYAIEMGIVTPVEAQSFVSAGSLTQINKVTMAVFTGRALNVYKKENLNRMVTLSYKDAATIPVSAMRYVDFLVSNNVISEKGNAQGNFAPQTPLTRTLLATFIKGYNDALEKIQPEATDTENSGTETTPGTTPETTPPTETTQPPSKETEEKLKDDERLAVGEVVQYRGGTEVVLKTTGGEEKINLHQVPVFYGDKEVGLNAIANGITLTVKLQNGSPTNATVNKVFDRIEGTFSNLGSAVTTTPSFKPLRIEMANKTYENKRFYEDSIVTLNDAAATVDQIKKGDRIVVYSDGYVVKRIMAYRGEYETTAILTQAFDPVKKGSVAFVTESGFAYALPASTQVTLANQEAGFSKDVFVKVRIQDGVVTRLENIGKKEMVLGTVEAIYIKAKPELTFKVDGKSLSMSVSDRVVYLDETGKKTMSIYDLRLGQPVTVYKGLNGVYKLQLGQIKEVPKDESIYTITQIFASTGIMTVADQEGNAKTLVVKPGTDVSLSTFKVGDTIVVQGTFLTKDLIEASKITIKK